MSEYLVAEALWQLSHGSASTAAFGDAPIFDVLGSRIRNLTLLEDRGVRGIDFVDFLDGWFCRGHAERPSVQSIVTTDHRFPYDYAGPTSCP